MNRLLTEMLAHADPSQVAGLSRFFKTGPGQYGEGDKFLGIKVPVTREVVRHRVPPRTSPPILPPSEMKKTVAVHILAVSLLLLTLFPVKTAAEPREKEFPVVVFSAFTQIGLNTSIFGMYLELTNLATGEVYPSGEFWRYSRFSVIENIPQGRYVVTYCEAALPNGVFFSNCSDALTDFFGVIEIDSDAIWYLGDYKIRVLGNAKDAVFKLTGKPMSNRVYRKLLKDGYGRYSVHLFEPAEMVVTLSNNDFTQIPDN